jgi:hypothetical protein
VTGDLCEHLFVTSEGSAYARFRRALDARDPFGASAAALELHHVGLADPLELTLIYLDCEPARYDRAAVRLHARLCRDAHLSLDDSLAALGLLAGLRGSRARDAAHALASLVGTNRTLLPVAEVLGRWAERGSPAPEAGTPRLRQSH